MLNEAAENPRGPYTKAARRDNSVGSTLSHCGKPPHNGKTHQEQARAPDGGFRPRLAATIFPGNSHAIPDLEPP
jgi:hypothetical protein